MPHWNAVNKDPITNEITSWSYLPDGSGIPSRPAQPQTYNPDNIRHDQQLQTEQRYPTPDEVRSQPSNVLKESAPTHMVDNVRERTGSPNFKSVNMKVLNEKRGTDTTTLTDEISGSKKQTQNHVPHIASRADIENVVKLAITKNRKCKINFSSHRGLDNLRSEAENAGLSVKDAETAYLNKTNNMRRPKKTVVQSKPGEGYSAAQYGEQILKLN